MDTDCIVVGAGVIGLAVARRLALDGMDVVVLERADSVGTETSARSNEVVHAGIYYRPGSPQAVLCRRGHAALAEFCPAHSIDHREVGKLIIATDDESVGWLEDTLARATANGAPDVEMIDGVAARRLEPGLRCQAALWSPRTGIIDSHGLILAYRGHAEERGAAIALETRFVGAAVGGGGFVVTARGADGAETTVRCRLLVNAAGICSPEVASRIDAMPADRVPHHHLAKGTFFSLSGKPPFRHLIVPDHPTRRGGGIFTLDLAGRGRFGPDEKWVETPDYVIEGHPVDGAYAAVRRYYPSLPDGVLGLDYAGIQPRLQGPGEVAVDWRFQGEAGHGVSGLINLYGFDSPGITASLPIADVVAGMLAGRDEAFGSGAA
jgi:L-2-hydroxyglutarate oxidase LhgO